MIFPEKTLYANGIRESSVGVGIGVENNKFTTSLLNLTYKMKALNENYITRGIV